MADAVDAAQDRQQRAAPYADLDLPRGDSGPEQLPPSHYAVLPARDPRDYLINGDDFSTHTVEKSAL